MVKEINLQPLGDRVIVRPINQEEITKSGIVLPDTAEKEKPERGEVVAVGSGKLLDNGQRVPINVKVGQRVVFKKYSPDEIKMDNEKYLIISEEDILAIIKK